MRSRSDSRATKQLSSWLSLGGAYALSALVSFIYAALVGRRLGPAAAADFYSGLFVIYLLAMLVSPLGGALSRTAAAAVATGRGATLSDHHRRMHRTTLLLGLLVLLALLLMARPLAEAIGLRSTTPLVLALGTGVVLALLAVDRGFLRGVGEYRAFSTSQIVENIVRVFVGGIAILRWPSAGVAIAAYLPGSFAAWLVARRQIAGARATLEAGRSSTVWPTPTDPDPEGTGDHQTWRWVVPLLVVAVSEAGYQNLDPLIARASLGEDASGIYGGAATLARSFGILASPFVATALPDASAAYARGEGVLRSFLTTAGTFVLAALLPLAICLAAPGRVVQFVLGSEYGDAAHVLPVFAVAWVAGCAALLAAQALVAAGRIGFLPLFLVGLLVEFGWLLRAEPDPLGLARITLVVKTSMLLVLFVVLAWSSTRARRSPASIRGSVASDQTGSRG